MAAGVRGNGRDRGRTVIFKDATNAELGKALAICRRYFLLAGIFSAAINLLYLASPLYMLQVYDRVVTSGSVPTLVMLTIALLIALAAMAAIDNARARVLVRAGIRLDRTLSERVMSAMVRHANSLHGTAGGQPLRDLDSFRQFITGSGIHVLMDAPWAPIYIVVIFLLHPFLGLLALIFGVTLLALGALSERVVRKPLSEAGEASNRNYAFTEASVRNSHVIEAMGMMGGLLSRWNRDRNKMMGAQALASDRSANVASTLRFMRLAMQSLMLGAGAYLVIERLVSPGVMFVGMLLLARALLPIEQGAGAWRQFVSAQDAYRRIAKLLAANPLSPPSTMLPRPLGRLSAHEVTFHIPQRAQPLLDGINFIVEPGETLGVIGPSGAGKSTLARLVVGIHAPTSGVVRLDGADVAKWNRAEFGKYVGYLPQEIELFVDTVAANIARFATGRDDEIIRAAKLAGAHEIILGLPNGYETQIGEGGINLSGGHRQRIGLARALFGDPSLIVLDEPSSNLDTEGDVALANCLAQLKELGRTVFLISHRQATLNTVDKILVLQNGSARMFGARKDVLAKLGQPSAVPMIGPLRGGKDSGRSASGAG
jgi:PrtD family type I secretion system ABC transporter